MRGAHRAAIGSQAAVKARGRNPEVGDQSVAVPVEENVVGFDVTVHDAAAMRKIQSGGDLTRDDHGPLQDNRAVTREFVGETTAAEIGEDEVDDLARLVVVHGCADEGMHQATCGFGLAAKADAHFGVAREMSVHDLHGERATESFVFCVVDVRHAAGANAPEDPIPIAHSLTQCGDHRVRHFGLDADRGELGAALEAGFGGASVPGAAARTEQRRLRWEWIES